MQQYYIKSNPFLVEGSVNINTKDQSVSFNVKKLEDLVNVILTRISLNTHYVLTN